MKVPGPFFILFMMCAASGQEAGEWGRYHYDTPLPKLLDSLKIKREELRISISKTRYELTLMAGATKIKSYPVVFGPNPVDDKLREGDGCTPEGTFRIRAKYPHKQWSKFLWIDHPTADSWKKHKESIQKKLIPANAGIGGEIGIHGVPTGLSVAIDLKINWTAGCVSLKNKDIDEIYEAVAIGTLVEIRK